MEAGAAASTSTSDSESDSADFPENAIQARAHPDLKAFGEITGGRLPGLPQVALVTTLVELRWSEVIVTPALQADGVDQRAGAVLAPTTRLTPPVRLTCPQNMYQCLC